MNENLVIEYLHRILEKKVSDSKKIQERISILNHQIQHFRGMHEGVRKEVIDDLIKDIIIYSKNDSNWKTVLEQLKEVTSRNSSQP